MACTLLDVVLFLCTVSNEFILSTKKMLLAFRFDLSIKRKKKIVWTECEAITFTSDFLNKLITHLGLSLA